MCFKKKSKTPPFDWKAQPHLGPIPAVIGKWFTPSGTIGYDPTVYNSAGSNIPVPAYLSALAMIAALRAIGEIILYARDFGLTFTHQQTAPLVTIRFYYGPWTTRGVSYTPPYMPPFKDQLVVTTKTTSSFATGPSASLNLMGCAYVNATQKDIHGAGLWINVYPWEQMRLAKLANPTLDVDWMGIADGWMSMTLWHEIAHTWGLNDDPYGSTAGLMVYRNRLNRPSTAERDVLNWLYGGKA